MKEKVQYYKLENRIQTSYECLVSKVKSSTKVMNSLDKSKKQRSSSYLVKAPLAGKKMIKVAKSQREPLATGRVLKRDQYGKYSFVESTSDKIWGYLAKNDVMYPFEKHMDCRLADETPGYTIGGHPNSDIQIHHFEAEANHAIIYCKSIIIEDELILGVYLCNRSSTGTWVNSELVKDQVPLKHNDRIHFMDPERYSQRENECYTFVKPEYSTTSVHAMRYLYTSKRKIGSGKFGIVYLAECKRTRQLVAIKHISKEVINSSPKSKSSLLREISVCMAFPQHPCIIQISRLFEKDNSMFIVMEYGQGGDLFDAVSSNAHPLKEYEVRIIFDQIAHGVAFLHDHGIVHRDIKLENVIMCDRKNLIVKLCDFGLSTFIKSGRSLETNCGTMMYAAPELIECEKGYGVEIDIWSLGVLLFTALAMSTPFNQASEDDEEEKALLKANIKKGLIRFDNPIWRSISRHARYLIRNMLTVKIEERYNIHQVLEHPWLQDIENIDTMRAGLKRNPALVEYLHRHDKL